MIIYYYDSKSIAIAIKIIISRSIIHVSKHNEGLWAAEELVERTSGRIIIIIVIIIIISSSNANVNVNVNVSVNVNVNVNVNVRPLRRRGAARGLRFYFRKSHDMFVFVSYNIFQ